MYTIAQSTFLVHLEDECHRPYCETLLLFNFQEETMAAAISASQTETTKMFKLKMC